MSGNEISEHIERLEESSLCAAARGGRTEECAALLEIGAQTEWPLLQEHIDENDDASDDSLILERQSGR